jgi:hypothetical protein
LDEAATFIEEPGLVKLDLRLAGIDEMKLQKASSLG